MSLVILFILGRRVTDNAFKQIEEANQRMQNSHNHFVAFIESAYKANTEAMERFCNTFEEHIKAKDAALQMLKENQQMLFEQINANASEREKKRQVPKEYR